MNDIVMSTHGINISAFFAGASTSFYTIFALYILSCRERTRFQSVLGWLLAVWAVWSMKHEGYHHHFPTALHTYST